MESKPVNSIKIAGSTTKEPRSTQTPTFSVMTPVYNGEAFIHRCYGVLREQTFTDWEWVVVDDGSTDGTADIVRSIDDDRIRLISYAENQGRGYARTEALKACRGDWVVLWDADDIYFPDRLERIEAARGQDYDYYCSYAVVVDNTLRIKGVRGFLPASGILPRFFVHTTLACPVNLAREIGYDIFREKGGPGEDFRIVMTLGGHYNGFYDNDASAVYQEDREVNLQKSIDTNKAQKRALHMLYREGILPQRPWGLFALMVRRSIKITILHLMRIAPGLYLRTVKLRAYGDTAPGFQLSQQRREYIDWVRRTDFSESIKQPQACPLVFPTTPLRMAN